MDNAERNKIMRGMISKPILTTTKDLSIIPQMDLEHNFKQLSQWRLKHEEQLADVRHSRSEIKKLESKLRKRGIIK